MSELPLPTIEQKKDWTLNPGALDRLLNWLDEGADSQGLRYLEMRRRLASYFDRKNCVTPDDLADATLNRVARRLEEEGDIVSETPAKYCYIVARFVFLEHLRTIKKSDESFADSRLTPSAVIPGPEDEDKMKTKEKMLNCLEECTSKLEPQKKEIITRYYLGTGRRKIENRLMLAKELSVTINALSIRACRIRDKLEACVRQCATGKLK